MMFKKSKENRYVVEQPDEDFFKEVTCVQKAIVPQKTVSESLQSGELVLWISQEDGTHVPKPLTSLTEQEMIIWVEETCPSINPKKYKLSSIGDKEALFNFAISTLSSFKLQIKGTS